MMRKEDEEEDNMVKKTIDAPKDEIQTWERAEALSNDSKTSTRGRKR